MTSNEGIPWFTDDDMCKPGCQCMDCLRAEIERLTAELGKRWDRAEVSRLLDDRRALLTQRDGLQAQLYQANKRAERFRKALEKISGTAGYNKASLVMAVIIARAALRDTDETNDSR